MSEEHLAVFTINLAWTLTASWVHREVIIRMNENAELCTAQPKIDIRK